MKRVLASLGAIAIAGALAVPSWAQVGSHDSENSPASSSDDSAQGSTAPPGIHTQSNSNAKGMKSLTNQSRTSKTTGTVARDQTKPTSSGDVETRSPNSAAGVGGKPEIDSASPMPDAHNGTDQ
jgi:hypothetical protein